MTSRRTSTHRSVRVILHHSKIHLPLPRRVTVTRVKQLPHIPQHMNRILSNNDNNNQSQILSQKYEQMHAEKFKTSNTRCNCN